jgi:hypothetical protein
MNADNYHIEWGKPLVRPLNRGGYAAPRDDDKTYFVVEDIPPGHYIKIVTLANSRDGSLQQFICDSESNHFGTNENGTPSVIKDFQEIEGRLRYNPPPPILIHSEASIRAIVRDEIDKPHREITPELQKKVVDAMSSPSVQDHWGVIMRIVADHVLIALGYEDNDPI